MREGPVIVRHPETRAFVKPGLHSHNITRRRVPSTNKRFGALARFRVLLFLLGICALGYYGYTLANQYVYQNYENWAFDQQIAGHSAVTFADYLRDQTPFGFLVGPAAKSVVTSTQTAAAPKEPEPARPSDGGLLGRVEIPRLNLSAIVREGVDAKTLSTAVGHVPSTALPGQIGNFAIAAHRDTLFRVLKGIQKGDLVSFQAPDGTYSYQVVATKIVKPSDVTVLRSDGGGIITDGDQPGGPTDKSRLLTMITCYPFYYVGSAPKRFIVEAELVPSHPAPPKVESAVSTSATPLTKQASAKAPKARRAEPRHTRGASHLRKAQSVESTHRTGEKKRPLWRRLLHVS